MKTKVLYIDDQQENLNIFRIGFKRVLDVKVTTSADEALKILKDNSIDVLVADHRMPDITGIELLAQVGEDYPSIKRIIISEYINDVVIREAIKKYGFDGCMSKPWNSEEFLKMIQG